MAGLGSIGSSFGADAAYSQVNSLITAHSESYFKEEGQMKTFQPNYLQISRKTVTSVTIDGKTTTVSDKELINSVPIGLTDPQLKAKEVNYLSNRFYGEDSKIHGSTYTAHTCQNKIDKCKNDCCSSCSNQGSMCYYMCNMYNSVIYGGSVIGSKLNQWLPKGMKLEAV